MRTVASPYYPPRAGRSRHLYKVLDWVRCSLQRTQLGQQIHLSVPPLEFFKYCVVPGLGFRAAGWDRLARLALCCWATAFVVYLVALGYPTATFAFGLMMSIHVSSILCVLGQEWSHWSLVRRALVALSVVFSLNQFVYRPFESALENYCLMPVVSEVGPCVINRTRWGQRLNRGDLVAYRIQATGGLARISAGVGIDRILAVPGDVVEFTPTEFLVNGARFPKLHDMPDTGGLTLEPDVWFIWPSVRKTMHGNVGAELISATLLHTAAVQRNKILGKPFGLSLWHRQNR